MGWGQANKLQELLKDLRQGNNTLQNESFKVLTPDLMEDEKGVR